LIYGQYQDIAPEHPQIYAFTRTLKQITWMVVLNFSDQEVSFRLPDDLSTEIVMINNYEGYDLNDQVLKVKPFQALVFG
jgi:oligo-1,6-glucosidase